MTILEVKIDALREEICTNIKLAGEGKSIPLLMNYFEFFNLDSTNDLTDEQLSAVKATYRSLALRYHPDKTVDLSKEEKKITEEIFKYINEASQTILDRSARNRYREKIKRAEEKEKEQTKKERSAAKGKRAPEQDNQNTAQTKTSAPKKNKNESQLPEIWLIQNLNDLKAAIAWVKFYLNPEHTTDFLTKEFRRARDRYHNQLITSAFSFPLDNDAYSALRSLGRDDFEHCEIPQQNRHTRATAENPSTKHSTTAHERKNSSTAHKHDFNTRDALKDALKFVEYYLNDSNAAQLNEETLKLRDEWLLSLKEGSLSIQLKDKDFERLIAIGRTNFKNTDLTAVTPSLLRENLSKISVNNTGFSSNQISFILAHSPMFPINEKKKMAKGAKIEGMNFSKEIQDMINNLKPKKPSNMQIFDLPLRSPPGAQQTPDPMLGNPEHSPLSSFAKRRQS